MPEPPYTDAGRKNVTSAGSLAELAALRARALRQERELRETQEQMARVTNQVEAVSADLARSRAYAFDARAPLAEAVEAAPARSLATASRCSIT